MWYCDSSTISIMRQITMPGYYSIGSYLMLKKNSVNQKSSDVLFLPMKLERIRRFISQLYISNEWHRRFFRPNYTPCSPSTSSPRWNSSNESQTRVCGNLWSASSHWWSEGDKQLINHKTLMPNNCFMIQYKLNEQWSINFAQISTVHTYLDNGEKGFGVILWVFQNVIYRRELEDACLKNCG